MRSEGGCMKRIFALMLIAGFVAAPVVSAATYGLLIEKPSAIYKAPANGVKGVLGTDILELNMQGKSANAKPHCDKMKADGCKVIVAIGKKAAKGAIKAATGLPIVYAMVMDPAPSGIKGANIGGVSLNVPMVRQFEAFKSTVPALKKVGLVYSSDLNAALVSEMKSAAGKTGLTLVEKKVASDADVPNAIREMQGQIDGLYLPPDRTVAKHDAFQFIALFTFENNLPFMAPTDRFVKKGALIALMIDFEEVGKQAAKMAQKVAGGSSPSAEPPEVTILVLNQKTASTIGINIPPSLLQGSKIIK